MTLVGGFVVIKMNHRAKIGIHDACRHIVL